MPLLPPTVLRSNSTPTATADSPSSPVQSLNQLRADYATAGTFDDRFDVVLKIAETRTADAVRLLQELFRTEPNKDLRVELINGLIGMEGCKDERLAFLSLGIARDQPPEVREAAIDGLVDLEDQRALELLRALSNDQDPAIARLARDSAALVERMLQ